MQLSELCTLISVFDCNVSVEFYQTALGFEVHDQAGRPDWVWLKRGDINLMLNTMYDPDDTPQEPDPDRKRAHEDTILYFGCPDVDAAYRDLVAMGVELDPPKTAHYGMRQLYFHDPDNYSICLQWRSG